MYLLLLFSTLYAILLSEVYVIEIILAQCCNSISLNDLQLNRHDDIG